MMVPVPALMRSVTRARVSVVPRRDRDPAFPARMARAAGEPLLRPAGDGVPPLRGDGRFDLSLGLHLFAGPAEPGRLVGSIAVRERLPDDAERDPAPPGQRPGRLIVLEAPSLDEGMRVWRPPLGALLAATAVVLVASTAHDPGFRTYVACRAPSDDETGLAAFDAIGARELGPGGRVGAPAGAGSTALRFLDAASAARASGIVLDHLEAVDPTWEMMAGGPGRACEGVLLIEHPRAVRSMREELEEMRAGRAMLDWHVPVVVGNDVGLPNGRKAHAAGL